MVTCALHIHYIIATPIIVFGHLLNVVVVVMAARLRRPHAKTDGPPVFSHEFIIQNHADIISCVCMVIFLGLLPQVRECVSYGLYKLAMYVCIY